ncbi:MAG: TlpA family protein disulfide reductase [Candidatus Krumholzibacteriia bacterium]
MQRTSILPATLVLLAALSSPAWPQLGPGDEAPDFSLPDFEGTEFTLREFRGKVVLLDLIGYACSPCIQSAPGVEAIWQDFKETGAFQALALDMWNGAAPLVQTFIDQTAVSFPVLRHAAFLQGPAFYGITFDNYVVIDPDGIIRYTSVDEAFGSFNDAAIRTVIERHLPVPVEEHTWGGIKELYR